MRNAKPQGRPRHQQPCSFLARSGNYWETCGRKFTFWCAVGATEAWLCAEHAVSRGLHESLPSDERELALKMAGENGVTAPPKPAPSQMPPQRWFWGAPVPQRGNQPQPFRGSVPLSPPDAADPGPSDSDLPADDTVIVIN